MSDFQIKTGDRLPVLNAILKRSDGVPVDLTGATVRFVMRRFASTDAKVNAAATIVSAAGGQVEYDWLTIDTDTPGIYDGSWLVTYANGERQTFPTDDYLEIEVQLDLSKTGVLIPNRPTDGIRPPVSAVAALLPTRGRNTVTGQQFGPGSVPSYQQVQGIIDMVSGELDGELAGAAVTPQLARLARYAITNAAAATVELSFFPEQAEGSSSQSGVLWSRYQTLLGRFRDLLEMEGGGPPESGTAMMTSPTLSAANAYADQLAAAGLLPDIWTASPEFWA